MIVTYAPGKLFIAGEYAVIEPGYSAILVAVNKFARVSLEKAEYKPFFDIRENRILYIKEAVKVVEEYAKEQGLKLDFYNIYVDSELETSEGVKYGLGSSAAVTVATIKALSIYYGITLTNEKLFKLAALANLSVKSNSSCGDIAASVYGGWIAYTTFDQQWVLEQRKKTKLTQLLNMDWPKLSLERLRPPKDLILLVGWTGKPISTAKMVDNFDNRKINKTSIYHIFLAKSKICIDKMIKSLKEDNLLEFQNQIKINREILQKLSKDLNMAIETPLLTKLCEIAIKFNGFAKSSGAGGGDCGIAFFNNSIKIDDVVDEWRKYGITYLPLGVYQNNS